LEKWSKKEKKKENCHPIGGKKYIGLPKQAIVWVNRRLLW